MVRRTQLENCFVDGDNCRLNFNAVSSADEVEDTYLVMWRLP